MFIWDSRVQPHELLLQTINPFNFSLMGFRVVIINNSFLISKNVENGKKQLHVMPLELTARGILSNPSKDALCLKLFESSINKWHFYN